MVHVSFESHSGVFPLSCAAKAGKVEHVKTLLERGADVNHQKQAKFCLFLTSSHWLIAQNPLL